MTTWAEVEANPEYQKLPADQKEIARNQYFDQVVAPKVPKDQVQAVRGQFDQQTKKTPEQPGMWSQIGRQVGLAARAPIEAATSLAALPADAVTGVVNYARNPYPLGLKDLNPLGTPTGGASPMPSQTISQGISQVLPTPESGMEKLAFGVESLLSGAKMPIPGSGPAARTLAEAARDPLRTGASSTAARGTAASTKDAKAAVEQVKKALTRDDTDLAEASKAVAAARQSGVPMTLADTGPNATTTAEVLAQRPGAAQKILHQDRLQTLQDTKTRVPGQVRGALDVHGDAGLLQDDLTRFRSEHAKENYEAVRQDSTPVTDEAIWHILENPTVARLYQDARGSHMTERSLATTAGKPSPPLADIYAPMSGVAPHEPGRVSSTALPPPASEPQWVRTGTAPDVRSLDYLARRMDNEITRLFAEARKGGTGGGIAQNLKALRDQLIGRLKQLSPAYKRASEQYGTDSELMDARAFGGKDKQGFLSLTPGQAVKHVNGLSESGQTALIAGVTEKLLAGAEQTGRNVNIAANVLGGPRQEAILRTLFKSDQDFGMFKKVLEAESKVFQNTQQITRNSATFRRAAAAEDFEQMPVGEKVAKGVGIISRIHHGWLGTAAEALWKMMSRPDSWKEGKAEWAARILTSDNPEMVVQKIKWLEQQASVPRSQRVAGKALPVAKVTVAASGSRRPATLQDEEERKKQLNSQLSLKDLAQTP